MIKSYFDKEGILLNGSVNKKNALRQLFLYGIIGSFSSSVDTLSCITLRKLGLEIYTANFIGINTGISISFLLNTFINF